MINKLKRIWGLIGPLLLIGLGVYILNTTQTLLGQIIGWTSVISWSALFCFLIYKLISTSQINKTNH